MTTTVKVEAHCGTDEEVRITNGKSVVILQDGESHEDYVYDDKEITVREVKKSESVSDAAQKGFDEGISSHKD